MKFTIFILITFFSLSTPVFCQINNSKVKKVSVDTFYLDEKEINGSGGRPYKLFVQNTQRSDSIFIILCKYHWTTCGRLDSIQQYRKIQLINKSLLKGVTNCTGDWAAQSEWKFSNVNGKYQLSVKNTVGWDAPDEFKQSIKTTWDMKYDFEQHAIYLYNSEAIKYILLIVEISENRLILSPVKK